MTKEQFTELLKSKLEEATGCKVLIQPVLKNNNVELTSLTVQRVGINTSPTIYVEPLLELFLDGETFENLLEKVLRFERAERLKKNFNVDDFLNFDKIKENIYYRLVNYNTNKKLLETVPYKRVLDLAKIYYAVVESPELGTGSIVINNEHLKYWGVDDNEVDRVASINTGIKSKPVICNIRELIVDQMMNMFEQLKEEGEIPEDANIPDLDQIGEYPMYVVTNDIKYYGAATLVDTDVLNVIADSVEDDLIIFPSSVHEFIFIKAELGKEVGYATLKNMVENANREAVSEEDFLSDSVYLFNRHRKTLSICSEL